MSDKNKLVTFETVNDLMLFKWGDGLESYINLKILREKCPCADCEGEKDVFGNIYKGRTSLINENSFLLKGIQPVGYYALRPFWNDGHHSGIYSFEFLRTLCENLVED
ncbi:MAG: DUF971 domain-containing protein [Candidatus Neomarinimicrobiota bacterium]|nr:DUF971 domain-containing protein [Candidatus Neomarinimicrobiota bacterium]|tara:strand:- start:1412 stop:1735 length:324 start_codon:yes stop_codon:yes gene_type:complete